MRATYHLFGCLLLLLTLASCEEDPVAPPYVQYDGGDTVIAGVSIEYSVDSAQGPVVNFTIKHLTDSTKRTASFDFGDSTAFTTIATDTTISHRYEYYGKYPVRVTLKDSAERVVVFKIDLGPEPAFRISFARDAKDSLRVALDVRVPDFITAGAKLDFGDGVQQTVTKSGKIYHTYPAPKEYIFTAEYLDQSNTPVAFDTLLNLRNRAGTGSSITEDLDVQFELLSQDSMLIQLEIAVGAKAYGVFIDFGDGITAFVRNDKNIRYFYSRQGTYSLKIQRLNASVQPTDVLLTRELSFERPTFTPDESKLFASDSMYISFTARFTDGAVRTLSYKTPDIGYLAELWKNREYDESRSWGNDYGGGSYQHFTRGLHVDFRDNTSHANVIANRIERSASHYGNERKDSWGLEIRGLDFSQEESGNLLYATKGHALKSMITATYNGIAPAWDDLSYTPSVRVVFGRHK